MKKLLSALLATLLVVPTLAACSKEEEPVSSEAPAPVVSEAEEPEPPAPDPQAFLTGLEAGENTNNRRATAIMVNNLVDARPQSGLSDAQILFELRVEGGITRFMALYEDYEKINTVGPIRSARDQFFQQLAPIDAFYVHIGESVKQTEFKNSENYEDLDINADRYGQMIYQDADRVAAGYDTEHTKYSNGELIAEAIDGLHMEPAYTYEGTFLNFEPLETAPRAMGGSEAPQVTVMHSQDYHTQFDYDGESGQYMMSMYNWKDGTTTPTVDANNEQQLGFENLLILFTEVGVWPGHEAADLRQFHFPGGEGFYLNEGKAEPVTWKKGDTRDRLEIIGADGNPAAINPGKSYITFVEMPALEDFKAQVTPGEAAPAEGGEEGAEAQEAEQPDEQEVG